MFAHLHTRSWFSFLAGGSSPEALAARAAALGMEAVALTDVDGLYGAVRFATACREHGIRPIYGAEVRVLFEGDGGGGEDNLSAGQSLVLLAANRAGYANLCRLLTRAHDRDREVPAASFDELATHADGLFCLTGARGSRLWALVDAERGAEARAWVGSLHEVFGERLSVEVAHHLHPGDSRRVVRLARLARALDLPLLATGDARHASAEDYRRYDLLTCVRLGQAVFDPHPERPRNGEAHLKEEAALRRLIPIPEAFDRAAEVAAACRVDLLPGRITPPAVRLPEGTPARSHLRAVCETALEERFVDEQRQDAARRQLEHELAVIGGLGLDEFFLVVREVVEEARRRGIRCAGRGSAANSLVAYLSGITGVDPLAHNLLFERFLHTGRAGTPDIDVDFDSERRHEVIEWMEERFGHQHTAMTATLTTYRLRSALRDAARALGWDLDTVNRLTKAVPPGSARGVREHEAVIRRTLGESPLIEPLLTATESLAGCPRHLGLHSGGMVLSRPELAELTPVQVSANGVRVVQFDKDDVEALGLVKLDVLGLRMFSALSEADELVRRHTPHPDVQGYPEVSIDDLPLDDPAAFELIRAGRTLGCFQIESQGQLHLLAQHQPETFNDLITEIALFRPGPLQGNMVRPFVRRRRGEEPVTYDHESLAPILRDTQGVILFQEQVLEVAHRFAGMPLDEADQFRRLMSKFRDPGEMESIREPFVAGATGRGVPRRVADQVFERVSKFVGYGFCRSHAAAFAKTVYQSAYLKRHHPAAFMAALFQHRPGMYSLQTLQEEARHLGVETLPPDIHRSGVRYDLEPVSRSGEEDGFAAGGPSVHLAIRMPLTAVRSLSAEHAVALVRERALAPFASVEDLYRRVALPADTLDALARSGALDQLAAADGEPVGSARRALWEVGVLRRRLGLAGQPTAPTLFDLPAVEEEDIPELLELTRAERLMWDLHAQDAAREHPMTLVRRHLASLEVRPVEACYRLGRVLGLREGGPQPVVTIAGLAVLRQRPPTANGVLFVLLEDETGLVQCIVRPRILERLDDVLRSSALIARGRLLGEGEWRGLLLTDAWPLHGVFGGYEGHPSMGGGLDRRVSTPGEAPTSPTIVARSSRAVPPRTRALPQ